MLQSLKEAAGLNEHAVLKAESTPWHSSNLEALQMPTSRFPHMYDSHLKVTAKSPGGNTPAKD